MEFILIKKHADLLVCCCKSSGRPRDTFRTNRKIAGNDWLILVKRIEVLVTELNSATDRLTLVNNR